MKISKEIIKLSEQTRWTKDEVKLLLENGTVFKSKHRHEFLKYNTSYEYPYRFINDYTNEDIMAAWDMDMYIVNKEIFKDKSITWLD